MNANSDLVAKDDIDENADLTRSERDWAKKVAANNAAKDGKQEKAEDKEKNEVTKFEIFSFVAGGPSFTLVSLTAGFLLTLLTFVPFAISDQFGLYDLNGSYTSLLVLFPLGVAVDFFLPITNYKIMQKSHDLKLPAKHKILYRMWNIGLAVALVVAAFQLPAGNNNLEDMSNLQNTDDEKVQQALTVSLAAFSACCFDPEEGAIAPPFDCDSTNNTQPCYEDIDSFDDFISSLDFNSTLCTLDVGGSTFSSSAVCDAGPENYIRLLADVMERRMNAAFIVSIVIAALVFASSAVCFSGATFTCLSASLGEEVADTCGICTVIYLY